MKTRRRIQAEPEAKKARDISRADMITEIRCAVSEYRRPIFSYTKPNKDLPRLPQWSLKDADFSNADLSDLDFRDTDLQGATFQDVDLSGADLSQVMGLLAGQFSGANLSRCKLPPPVEASFNVSLINIAELSKNAGTLFSILVVSCGFVLLVAFTTKDIQLLIDSGSATLPVINLAVSPRTFLGIAPWVLFGQFVTMHLYLQRLWALMATLPALFPDGTPLDRKSYPWLLNDLVRSGFPHLQMHSVTLAPTQRRVFTFLAYHFAALCVLLVAVRCLMRQDIALSGLHVVVLVLFVGAIRLFRHVAHFTLFRDWKEQERYGKWRHNAWHWKTFGWMAFAGLMLILLGPAFVPLWLIWAGSDDGRMMVAKNFFKYNIHRLNWSPTSIWRGDIAGDDSLRPIGFKEPELNKIMSEIIDEDQKINPLLRRNNPVAFSSGLQILAQERYTKIIIDSAPRVQFARVGAWQSFAFLQARSSFLVNADFRGCDLRGASFRNAILTHADFSNATLAHADLSNATIAHADLTDTNLEHANIDKIDAFSLDMTRCSLNRAVFSWGSNFMKDHPLGDGIISPNETVFKIIYKSREIDKSDPRISDEPIRDRYGWMEFYIDHH